MQILTFFTSGGAFATRLPRNEILSRSARGLTPCPGPRAHNFRCESSSAKAPMNPVAQVELESLLKVAAGATVAGVGVTPAFALPLRGFIAAELNRQGDRFVSALAGTLAAIGLIAGLGGVIAGLVIVAGR